MCIETFKKIRPFNCSFCLMGYRASSVGRTEIDSCTTSSINPTTGLAIHILLVASAVDNPSKIPWTIDSGLPGRSFHNLSCDVSELHKKLDDLLIVRF